MSKHNWIVGVQRLITEDEKIERKLDFIIHFSDEEAENFHSASLAASNQLWETSEEEACQIFNCRNLAAAMKGASIRVKTHSSEIKVYKFFSDTDWTRHHLEAHIKMMSIEELEKARLPDWK